jgi:hypothetical protein
LARRGPFEGERWSRLLLLGVRLGLVLLVVLGRVGVCTRWRRAMGEAFSGHVDRVDVLRAKPGRGPWTIRGLLLSFVYSNLHLGRPPFAASPSASRTSRPHALSSTSRDAIPHSAPTPTTMALPPLRPPPNAFLLPRLDPVSRRAQRESKERPLCSSSRDVPRER